MYLIVQSLPISVSRNIYLNTRTKSRAGPSLNINNENIQLNINNEQQH